MSGYLKELEFSIHALGLAMNVVNASKSSFQPVMAAPQLCSYPTSGGVDSSKISTPAFAKTAFSPSAFLRASNRIQDMHKSGSGGDLTITTGALYIWTNPHTGMLDTFICRLSSLRVSILLPFPRPHKLALIFACLNESLSL